MTLPTLADQRGGAYREDAVAQLSALFSITRLTSRAVDDDQLLRYAAQAALGALDASSVSIERFEREHGWLRTLINVGDLADEEEALPDDETYPVHEFYGTSALDQGGAGSITDRDDPTATIADPAEVTLLHRLGKQCSLEVPITIDGLVWGILYATRAVGRQTFSRRDLEFAATVATQVAAAIAQGAHNRRLEALASLDPLTGLASRRAVDDCLDRAFDDHVCDARPITVVICDVNGLKQVNDQHGHAAGDRLLQRSAELLSRAAGELPGSLAGRLGGDEFCLVVPQLPVQAVIDAVQTLCRDASALPGGNGMACGIAATADPVGTVRTAGDLMRLADDAQYRAKRAGVAVPVVAGRLLPPVVARALSAPSRAHAVLPDQRLQCRDSDVAYALLADVVHRLDGAETGHSLGDRLGVVGAGVARALDAAAWWVTTTTAGDDGPRTVRSGGPRGAALAAPVLLAALPRAADGGWAVGDLDPEDPAARAICALGGAEWLAAAAVVAGETWSVLVLADTRSRRLRPFGPTLRALVGTALLARC